MSRVQIDPTENTVTISDPITATINLGTDAGGTNAGIQAGSAPVGSGLLGWESTIAGLFQNGLAQVIIRRLTRLDDFVRVSPDQSGTAVTTTVNQNVASVTLLAANLKTLGAPGTAGRTGVIIFNTSLTSKLYLSYTTPAVIDGTQVAVVPPGDMYGWTMPMDAFYSGPIYGIWDAGGTAKAIVTELTT